MASPAFETPQELITTYLEMTSSRDFAPSFVQQSNVRIERLHSPDVDFYRFLYQAVGEKWCWRDRLLISRDELSGILQSPTTHVYVLYVRGTPAGYVELEKQGDGFEIAYFGLREAFFGRGLGKHLLSYGIDKAWQMGAKRVWLHTCNLDGPHALANYQKRGFRVFKQEAEPMPQRYM